MSEENVEIVRKAFAYEYLDRGGRADAATYFTADFQMNPIEGFGDEEPDLRSKRDPTELRAVGERLGGP